MTDARAELVRLARQAVANNARWRYGQVRPIPLGLPTHYPLTTDCSGACILLYHSAGCQDPSGHGFSGQGWSGDFYVHGAHIDVAQALEGDLVTFGPGGDEHAAMVVEPGANPLCFSHGQAGDPHLVLFSVLSSLGPAQFLRFSTIARELHPTAAQLAARQLVAISDADVPEAISHGWTIFKWTGWQFAPMTRLGGGIPLYANEYWRGLHP
jgi:hypothetical protein